MLHEASAEQLFIVDSLSVNQHVCVDSVAGSGKSTTNFHIAKRYRDREILLLTYNANLRLDTRSKAFVYGIDNLEVHTYHSYYVNYYDRSAFTDDVLEISLASNKKSMNRKKYDIIIIDEAQDMKLQYFHIVWLLLHHMNNKNVKLCIIGDRNQCIYDTMGSSDKFLTLCDRIFTYNAFPWVQCKLTVSYRITSAMADFINVCMLNSTRITSTKRGDLPKYLLSNTYNESDENSILKLIIEYQKMGYVASDFFILAPSVKSQSSSPTPVNLLVNLIKRETDMDVYINNDNTRLDEKVLRNKILISTIHKSKGLERKIVIVYSFDESYFTFFNVTNKLNTSICPNVFYVACTRALEHLIVVHSKDFDFFSFLKTEENYEIDDVNDNEEDMDMDMYMDMDKEMDMDMDMDKEMIRSKRIKIGDISLEEIKTRFPILYKHCDVIVDEKRKRKPRLRNNKIVQKKYLTTLLKCTDVSKYMQYITRTIIRESKNTINIPNTSNQPGDKFEEVSAITGTCIPAAYLDNFKNIILQLSNYVLSMFTSNEPIYEKSIEIKICDSFLSCMCKILQQKKITMYMTDHVRTEKYRISKIISLFTEYASKTIFSVEHGLEIANVMNARISYQVHQLDQIKLYDWLTESNLQVGMSRVESLGILTHDNISELSINTLMQIPEQDMIELREKYHVNTYNLNGQHFIMGSIDCVCEITQSIYEFKCTSLLTNEHYLQLAMYKYMYDIAYPLLPKKKSMIYNILTDELVEVFAEESDMKMIIESILLNHCITKKDDDDNQFIQEIDKFKRTVDVSIPAIEKKKHDGTMYAYLVQRA